MSGLEGLLAGRTLVKRYRIEEVIGRGGFAAVYRADDERLGRPVAVKVITLAAPDEESRRQLRERFQREARAAASLPQHPNVVTVYDFGTDPELGLDFLVMEFLPGEDLSTHLARQRRLPLDSARRVLRDAVEGVAVGHRAGLIHRDVKPGNIFLAEPHGEDPFRVCVLDFGIARVAAHDQTVTRLTTGGVPLSPAYASPEQLRGDRDLSRASDVFSLGVVSYQLLTGERPLRADRTADPEDWVPERSIRELNPEVPAAVEAVVMRAMSYAVEDRYPDADAFARALDEAFTGVARPPRAAAVPAPPPPALPDDEHTLLQPEPPLPPPAARAPAEPPADRRRPATALWLVALVTALVTVAGLWALTRGGPPDRPAAGEIILEQDGGEGDEPVRSETPPVTGEIIESPSTDLPADPTVPGSIAPAPSETVPPFPTPLPGEVEDGVVLPPLPGTEQPQPQPQSQPQPQPAGPGGAQPAPSPGAQPLPEQPQPQPEPASEAPAPTSPAEEPRLLGVPADRGAGGAGGGAGASPPPAPEAPAAGGAATPISPP